MSEWTLTGLRVMRAVAEAGSFTAAAEELAYTQSAVSRQVALMEAAAGTALFQRRPRGVTLTPAGEVLLRHAVRVEAELEQAGQTLGGLRDRLAGRLTLGVFPSAAAVLAPQAIAGLVAEHPGLAVTLTEGPTPALLRRLTAGRIEVAVIGAGAGLPDWSLDGLERTVVSDAGLRVAVPAGHRFARRSSLTVDAVRHEPWIVGTGAPGDPQFGAWPTLVNPTVAYAVPSMPGRLGMVAAGLGLSVIPALAAAAVPAGVTVVPLHDPLWAGRATLAVTRADPTPAAAAAVAALGEAGRALNENGP